MGGWVRLIPAASATAAGIVELATVAEAVAGEDAGRAVTPAGSAAAIQCQKPNFAIAAGTANALTLTLDPVPVSLVSLVGAPLRVIVATANTGPATLNVNGLGVRSVTRAGGLALKAGDLPAGRIVTVIYDGTAFQIGDLPIEALAGRLIAIQTFTTSGTYTPTPGMTFCTVEGVGGGGSGAGANNPGAGSVSLGSPGGEATSGRSRFTAAEIGTSKAVTIGAPGIGASAANGGNGGTTSLGSLMTLPGGQGGLMFNNASTPAFNGNGSVSAPASGANIAQRQGITPGYSTALSANASGVFCGPGGGSPYGQGRATPANSNGSAALGYGSGGGGVAVTAGGGPATGGSGSPGILIILEFGA